MSVASAEFPGTKTHMSYVPALDGLRAVAVSAVMAHHFSPFAQGGWVGVDIFFVLSGFLITSNLQMEYFANGKVSLARFYTRRCLRLMPAFLFFVYIAALFITFKMPQIFDLDTKLFYVLTYSWNWARALGFTEEDRILGHMWSLATEEQFYLLWPLLFLLLTEKLRKPFLIAAVFIVIALRLLYAVNGASHDRIYYGFDTHCDGLLLGCLLAISRNEKYQRLASCFIALPLIAFVIMFVLMSEYTEFAHMCGLTIASFVSAWLVLAMLEENVISRLLSLSPIVFVGKISYGLYLCHMLIFNGDLHIQRPLLIVLSFAAAMTSYHFVEQPFLKLKNLFDPKYRELEPAGPSAPMR